MDFITLKQCQIQLVKEVCMLPIDKLRQFIEQNTYDNLHRTFYCRIIIVYYGNITSNKYLSFLFDICNI